MLSVQHLTTGYGKKQVLDDVSFHVAQGETVLLTGGNGSGKSTVLKSIFGLLTPWNKEAKIAFQNQDIAARPPAEMIRLGLAYVPQKRNIFEDLTVEENLLTAAAIYPAAEARERATRALEALPALRPLRRRTPFHMSGGERQLLAFANALVHTPTLLLLDEPLAGVDTTNAHHLTQTLKTLNTEQNVTLLIVEHRMEQFEGFSGAREIYLKLGRIDY